LKSYFEQFEFNKYLNEIEQWKIIFSEEEKYATAL